MECADVAERLTDLMEGDLDPDEESAALEHLATCQSCEQVLAETRDVVSLARTHGRVVLTEAERARRFGALMDEWHARPDR